MMEVIKERTNEVLTVYLKGNLDTNTSDDTLSQISESLDASTKKLVIDLKEVDYLSSAGLRVILTLHKQMIATKSSLIVCHANDTVMNVFDMTGFSSIIKIEE